jgi:hypothetical protein
MRQILIFLAIFMCSLLMAQTKKNLESKIDKVTIFLEGAQVQRSTKVTLMPGKYELFFTNISPSIDKQSIQVKADGSLIVLSVIHQQNFLKEQQKQDEMKVVEEQKENLLEKTSLQKNFLNVFKQEEAMLIKNQQIGGSNIGLKAVDLKDAADFQRSRLTEVYQKQMETDKIIKKLETELTKMNKQLIELNQKSDMSTSEIFVTVNVKETTTSNFVITYLVKQAGWFTTYDISVKDISSPIHLQYKANVFQSSGEDWKDIKMFLSTGNPNEEGTKPTIDPWYLKYIYSTQPVMLKSSNEILSIFNKNILSGKITDENGKPLVGATVVVKGTTTATVSDVNGNFKLQMPAGTGTAEVSYVGYQSRDINTRGGGFANVTLSASTQYLSEVVVTGYGSSGNYNGDYTLNDESFKKKKEETAINTTTIYQPTTTVYEIQDPYTILNDGKTYMVDINGYEINALYEYYAAPKLEPDAFLTAKIVDWQEFNLLPGEANLFFEGTFLGKSILDVGNAGDTLKLSLGKDKGVVVKRTLLKDFSSKKFLGSNKTDTRQYEILVRNNKLQSISIIIEDQFPISTQKEIEISDRKYDGAKLDGDTQKITWQFSVDPKKENKVNFKYEVKYPKEKILQLD